MYRVQRLVRPRPPEATAHAPGARGMIGIAAIVLLIEAWSVVAARDATGTATMTAVP